jgi:hypothetical protein
MSFLKEKVIIVRERLVSHMCTSGRGDQTRADPQGDKWAGVLMANLAPALQRHPDMAQTKARFPRALHLSMIINVVFVRPSVNETVSEVHV